MKKKTKNLKVDHFINDLVTLCRKHKLSLSHEDLQGAFLVVSYDISFEKWLEQAIDKTK
jgi:hypothetical protein